MFLPGGIVKRIWLLSLFCLTLGIGNARADIIQGTTNPGLFSDSVNWCTNFTCAGQPEATPSPWTSAGGNTGEIGTTNGFEPVYVLQQGATWAGDFQTGMGLIYNGAQFGNNSPSPDIAAFFDSNLFGAGAWIQSNYHGAF